MFRRVLATTAAVAALAAVPAPAATAKTPVGLTVTGAYTGVFVSGLQIVASCDAVAVGVVAATVIDQCYLTSNGVNHPSAMPGNVASSTFVERVRTLEFTLCFSAYTIPVDDPTNVVRAWGCATDTREVDEAAPGGGLGDSLDVDLRGLAGAGSAFATA